MRNLERFLFAAIFSITTNVICQDDEAVEEKMTLPEAKAAFKKADAELNRVYQDVKKAMPDWTFEKLRDEQKKWIAYRDEKALNDAVFNGGDKFHKREAESVYYWESLVWNTENRSEIVAAWKQLGQNSGEVPWSGFYSDGFGGWMSIATADQAEDSPVKNIKFFIEVVRGPTAHSGSIDGEAKVNSEMAFFSDNGKKDGTDAEPNDETWLVFKKEYGAPHIKVDGANTTYYHGMRAYFGGVYTRIRDLTKKERNAILKGERPFDFNEN